MQPVALIGYGAAFSLHVLSDWQTFAKAPLLAPFAATAVCGSLLGRVIGPHLPLRAITISIRSISILACIVLLHRAYLIA